MNLPVFPGELFLTRQMANRPKRIVRPKGRMEAILPMKVGMLLTPVVLIIGLNIEVFYPAHVLAAERVEAFQRQYGAPKKGEDFEVGFLELFKAAAHAETRAFFEGKTVRISGRFVGQDERRFTLIRYRMACCAADATPLNAVVMVDPDCPETLHWKKLQGKWVEVQGELRYLKISGTETHACILLLKPAAGKTLDSVLKVNFLPANPYIN